MSTEPGHGAGLARLELLTQPRVQLLLRQRLGLIPSADGPRATTGTPGHFHEV